MRYLTHLLYTSRAAVPFSAAELRTLADQSAERNRSVLVTGMLLYSAGLFVQLLEGRATTLDALMKRITADTRHSDLRVLLRVEAKSRLFPRWYMGALNLDTHGTARDRARVEDALLDDAGTDDSGERILAVLREFRRHFPERDG